MSEAFLTAINLGALVLVAAFGAGAASGGAAKAPAEQTERPAPFRWSGVRYQVRDVERSVRFYTERLGFKVDQQPGPAFAAVSLGPLKLWLSGPGSSGARPLPDGRKQDPGGSNRIVLQVADLPAVIAALEKAGLRFRNKMEEGPGGKQVQIEDPDGNPIEIFQPAA